MNRLVVVVFHVAVAGLAFGRPLEQTVIEGSLITAEGRRLQQDDSALVLSLDAANPAAGLLSLTGGIGDATWPSFDDPAAGVKLHSAGFDQAYGGGVLFTAPKDTTGLGTYGEADSSGLTGVRGGVWGDEFTGVAWYRGPTAPVGPDANPVLLQVAWVDSYGELRPSATWRLAGFEDQSQGYRPLDGFSATPTYSAASLGDCWQQLAVVKSGPTLKFFVNKELAGSASARYVVNDYGAAAVALGVDYSLLQQIAGEGNGTEVDTTGLDMELGWLSGSLGMVMVHKRALSDVEIFGIFDEQSPRFAETLCSTAPQPTDPVAVASPPIGTNNTTGANAPPMANGTSTTNGTAMPGVGPLPPKVNATATNNGTTAPNTPPMDNGPTTNTTGNNGTIPPKVNATATDNGTITPTPTLTPPPPSPKLPPSTFDNSTAAITGSGAAGTVKNRMTFTGGPDMATFDEVKQTELKQAIVASLNLDESYTAADIEIRVISVTQRQTGPGRKLQGTEWVVVVEYTLSATAQVEVEVLEKAEVEVYLFIRVQAPKLPWWKGPTATVCISNEEGVCKPNTPPVTPPVEVDCSASVCFLLDGSKSLTHVDAWNDVVAAARSIMSSIVDPASVFDVFYFSNDVERIGSQITRAELVDSNSFTKELVTTTPNAHGTWMEQAIQTCESVLMDQAEASHRTIVLITDGRPTDLGPSLDAAAQAMSEGIKMVVVGAGDVDYDTLKALASGPSYAYANFELDSSQLLQLADLASQGVCRDEEEEEAQDPSTETTGET